MGTDAHVTVTYAVDGEPGERVPVISRRRVERHADGTFTMRLDLSYARSRGMTDEESMPRIIAIAHPFYVEPEQVRILSVVGESDV